MKNNFCFLLPVSLFVGILTTLFGSRPAVADEVWTTEEYDVTYLEDRDRTAIWTYGTEKATVGTIFIDGLAGVFTDRGSYGGYWVQESSSRRCDTFREDINGDRAYYWGRFDITFIDPDFPSRWEASFGLCDGETPITLTGTPVSLLFDDSELETSE
ncbi:MAG: hypothetical protein AAF810_19630 [Cyanobacteria bacterium P01_D01_bin.36]